MVEKELVPYLPLSTFAMRVATNWLQDTMVLYNVTVGIDRDVEHEWLTWMLEEHIPAVMDTNMFVEYKIFKVLSEETENVSYSVQYFAENVGLVEKYLLEFAPALIEHHNERYRNKHVAFRTLLQQIL